MSVGIKAGAEQVGKVSAVQKVIFLGIKVVITWACFWYVLHQLNIDDLVSAGRNLNFRWILLAAIVMFCQIPLVGLRWAQITNALEPRAPPVPVSSMLAITWISNFFAQVLPNVMSDGIRIWLLARIRPGLRNSVTSVLIDRGVGVGTLMLIGFVTLLNPSDFTTFGGYRFAILFTFGLLIVVVAAGLLLARLYAPTLSHFRATKWIGDFVLTSRHVLLDSPAVLSILVIALCVHLLTIVAIWLLGVAFSMVLPLLDAAVLFTLMVAITIIPISVSGWGLRELAVTAFLDTHGVATQKAFLFSVCFGLTLIAAAMPGAMVLVFYSPRKGYIRPAPTS